MRTKQWNDASLADVNNDLPGFMRKCRKITKYVKAKSPKSHRKKQDSPNCHHNENSTTRGKEQRTQEKAVKLTHWKQNPRENRHRTGKQTKIQEPEVDINHLIKQIEENHTQENRQLQVTTKLKEDLEQVNELVEDIKIEKDNLKQKYKNKKKRKHATNQHKPRH